MDITNLAAWGEFLGGIAVVVSLIYLASQIRQNSKLLRASTTAMICDHSNAVAYRIAEDADLNRIYWDGLLDRESLSEEDRRRFDPVIGALITSLNAEYHLWREGAISPPVWQSRCRALRFAMASAGVRQWWRDWKQLYDDEFDEFVDGLIREGETAG